MQSHLKAALPTLSAAEASCPNRAVVRAEAIFPKLGCAQSQGPQQREEQSEKLGLRQTPTFLRFSTLPAGSNIKRSELYACLRNVAQMVVFTRKGE